MNAIRSGPNERPFITLSQPRSAGQYLAQVRLLFAPADRGCVFHFSAHGWRQVVCRQGL